MLVDMKEEIKQNFYYVIPSELAESGSPQKALLYGLITSLSKRDGTCNASDLYLAKKLGRRGRTMISQYIKELVNDGWLTVDNPGGKGRVISLSVRKTEHIVFGKPNGICSENRTQVIERVNKESISLQSKSSAAVDKLKDFNLDDYLKQMIESKQRHIQVIGLYAKAKRVEWENFEQPASFIKRNLRAAQDLKGYDINLIIHTMKRLRDETPNLKKWTLETVGKYIDEEPVRNSFKNKKIEEEKKALIFTHATPEQIERNQEALARVRSELTEKMTLKF